MTPQEERRSVEAENLDDMFGPPRATAEPPHRPRLSMISARLKANEERKRVIEICSQKLESIEDPARDLRRSVCINNTYCRLSEEARNEKEARKRGRDYVDVEPVGKKTRRAIEEECLALLDAIPELGEAGLTETTTTVTQSGFGQTGLTDCARLARTEIPVLQTGLLAVLDS